MFKLKVKISLTFFTISKKVLENNHVILGKEKKSRFTSKIEKVCFVF